MLLFRNCGYGFALAENYTRHGRHGEFEICERVLSAAFGFELFYVGGFEISRLFVARIHFAAVVLGKTQIKRRAVFESRHFGLAQQNRLFVLGYGRG